MFKLSDRINTFIGWDPVFAKKLAESGFVYLGKEDLTKCVFCNVEIKNWDLSKDPDVVHKNAYKFCPNHIQETFKNLKERQESFKIWTKPNINTNRMARTGFFYLGIEDFVQCFDCKKIFKEWQPTDDPFIVHRKLSKKCNQVLSTEDITLFCDICANDEKNVCFIPCGHVCCCIECSSILTDKCPMCKETIQSKMRIFY